ncbi:MAG: dephospho-CoA kinase, partial [Eubacterium sp.]|nr:dephospho-CoA kinase [Eubacterium sp.]
MIIGITGGVGCGKSTVLEILKKDYGAKVLIADNMGHEVMKKEGKAYPEIVDAFGTAVVGEDGELNRVALAELIYADDAKRERLNGIIHPCVKEEIKRKLKEWEEESLVVLETALLFETGCDSMCDRIWGI